MIHQQIKQAGQFARSGLSGIGLLRSSEKVKALFRGCHQAIEQRDIQAVQVLQGVKNAELRLEVEMKSGMSDGCEIHENHVPVRLLKRQRSVDGRSGATGAAFGAEKSEDA